MYEGRPKLNIQRTWFENFLDIASITLLVIGTVSLISQWAAIPNTVPTHFNAAGEPDGWGSKNNLWILIVMGAVTWLLLTVLEKFPHIYNYFNLTEENVERQYKNARMMINVMKNEILIFFVYMTWACAEVANGTSEGLSVWVLPIFIIGITGSIAFFIVRSIKWK
ncbi:DUF1648 domain-containing protein [Fictibacillus sp. 7GRE50]|uniref:DUF1648 domain-containing protein n=1 Tax=unclassified Fictibacillus TaxID=2644029 RepID=UPI0018CCD3B8|nr:MULTISPECIES: DUF1648 domain-containing protein [unclassified Fictibacillus]MBH0164282.1 DUF1648 domain-containing protein [Fictibacillus sp. 7GRE50]MBH0173591.1 DUF1648 domain-containing protein [Fictibacillus sp. 23RED33]